VLAGAIGNGFAPRELAPSFNIYVPTFPPCLEIPHTPRDSHFPSAPATAGLTQTGQVTC